MHITFLISRFSAPFWNLQLVDWISRLLLCEDRLNKRIFNVFTKTCTNSHVHVNNPYILFTKFVDVQYPDVKTRGQADRLNIPIKKGQKFYKLQYKCSLADAPGRRLLHPAQQQMWTFCGKLKCSCDNIQTWNGLRQRRYHSIHKK